MPGRDRPHALRPRADPRRRSTRRCRARPGSSCTGASGRRWRPARGRPRPAPRRARAPLLRGGVGKAVDYASRAGARAIALHAYEEAVRLYELALAAFEGGTPAERCACCWRWARRRRARAMTCARRRRSCAPRISRGPRGSPSCSRAPRRLRRALPLEPRAHGRPPRPAAGGGDLGRGHGRQRAARPAALAPGRRAAPRAHARAPGGADGGGDPDGPPDRRSRHDRVCADRRPSPRCTHRTPSTRAWPTRGRSSSSRRSPATASGSSTATSTRSGPRGKSATPIGERASWPR